jgi:hypothetical protein
MFIVANSGRPASSLVSALAGRARTRASAATAGTLLRFWTKAIEAKKRLLA